MKLTGGKNLEAFVNTSGQLKITGLTAHATEPYSPEVRLTSGNQIETIPPCASFDEFLEASSQTSVQFSRNGNTVYAIPKNNKSYTTSEEQVNGVYRASDGKEVSVFQESGTYWLEKFAPHPPLEPPYVYIKSGYDEDESGSKQLTVSGSAPSHGTILGLPCMEGQNFVLSGASNVASEWSEIAFDSRMSTRRQYNATTVSLDRNEFLFSDQAIGTTNFRLYMHGINERLLMSSPTFVLQGPGVNSPALATFRLRAGLAVNLNRIEVVASIPTDVRWLEWERASNGKVEIFADTPTTRTLVLRTTTAIQQTARWGLTGAEDEIQFARPDQQTTASLDASGQEGFMALVFYSQYITQQLVKTNIFDVSVNSGVLTVNGTAISNITVQQTKNYLLLVDRKVGSPPQLIVQLVDLTSPTGSGNQIQTLDDSATYTASTHTGDYEFFSQFSLFGEFLLTNRDGNTLAGDLYEYFVQKYSTPYINLGTFSGSTFSNTGSLDADSVLTYDGKQYARVQLTVNSDAQAFLQLPSNEITIDTTGRVPDYEQRIASWVITVDGVGINTPNKVVAEVPFDGDCSAVEPVEICNPGRCMFTVKYRDALDGSVRELGAGASCQISFDITQ